MSEGGPPANDATTERSKEDIPFTTVDDDAFENSRSLDWEHVRVAGIVFAYLLLFGGTAYGYSRGDRSVLALAGQEVQLLDWMTVMALLVLVAVVGPAVVSNRQKTGTFLRAFLRDRLAALALVTLVVLVGAAVAGYPFYTRIEHDVLEAYQPPVGVAVSDFVATTCVGPVVDGQCHGTMQYPLGTDHLGRDMIVVTLEGLRTSIKVGFTAAVITGGIGTIAGLVAGGFPGRADTAIMRYVDLQSAVPAFFVYVLLIALVGPDYVLLVLVFGLLSWGQVARIVRSEVVRLREAGYIRAARAAGGGSTYRLRVHVLPNVAGSALVPLTTLVPLYVLYEAALAFLGFGIPRVPSLGGEIETGLDFQYAEWWMIWWHPLVPATVLTLFVLSILLVGDRINEVAGPG